MTLNIVLSQIILLFVMFLQIYYFICYYFLNYNLEENMTINKKFQIDTTIIKLLENKNISFRSILKSTIQFIFALDTFLEHRDDTETILLDVITEYKLYTTIAMTNTYKSQSSYFTQEQEKTYNKISSKNRKYIINQLLSISINNNSYTNVINTKIRIEQDNIINEITLKYFTYFKKHSELKSTIIVLMKSLLFKLNRLQTKKIMVDSYYKELLIIIFNEYNDETNATEILKNPFICNFIYQELGKIFFIMTIEYNMTMRNESHNFRQLKYKYEQILENKYNNNLNKFIENELNLAKIDIEKQKNEFFDFYTAMHPHYKELTVILPTIFAFGEITRGYNIAKNLNIPINTIII
jgi:hypothetical protein